MKQLIRIFGMMVVVLHSSLSVSAYDFEVDGINYDITSFTELLVTASSISDSTEGDIVIPSTVVFNGKTLSVTAIGDNFAKGNLKITAVHIEEGLKEIGSFAFAECSSLSNMVIPESTVKIGASAFTDCTSIKEVRAVGLETLGENAFSNCVSIEKISFPKLTDIPSSAFIGCKELSYAEVTSVRTIGNSSFSGCAFSSFDLPSSVTKIGSSAFSECQNLEIFVISSNVSSIESGLFSNCIALKEVHIGSGVKSLPWIFEGCDNLEILYIDDAQSTLTFEYCGLREFTDGTKGEPINYTSRDYTPVSSMFQNSNLKEVYIGRNITTEAFCYKSVYMSGSYDGRYYYYIPNPPFSN